MRNSFFYSQNKGRHTLLLVSFLILIITFSFSIFTRYSNYVVYPIWVLWVTYILQPSNILSKNEQTFVKVSVLFLMVELVYWLTGYSSTETGQVLKNTNWILAGVVAVYAMKLFSEHELSMVYFIMTIALLVLMLFFIGTGRIIITMGEQDEAATVANAWYGSLYMLFSGLSLIVFLHVKKLFPRIIAIFVLVLTFYLNFVILQRGTNVIFTIAEISLILIFSLKKKPIIIMLSVVIFGFIIYAFSSDFLIYLFDWLAEISPSQRLSIRFYDLSTALTYDLEATNNSSLAGRNRLIGNSWDTFTDSFGHFIFGAGEHLRDHAIIGHHSFMIDTLARYGIMGGTMMFVYFMKQYRIFMSVLDKKTEWTLYMQCAIVFLFYVLRNFYGDMSFALVNLTMLVFFPLTFQIIHYYTNK